MLSVLCTLSSLLSLVAAYPTANKPQTFIVWNPRISSPSDAEEPWNWAMGERRNITWLTDDIPDQFRSTNSKAILGYWDDQSPGENLNFDQPLAQDFPLVDGWVEAEMPWEIEAREYFFVLFGDSGNRSPSFSVYEPEEE
ncbi:hypothetical protein CYLTODRAFT_419050 [Cylindrobasidium torrendii FP15055 ss-10]|uniref:Glycoside hydrolase family 16 protein n=1 Tax=Cylindrobasidium torrendii FP15055 ss-10 TaxID=1314674 RepID=A0A0D7BL79_9AGAR|nr:hypothetical protein CYLTODRAFT_419050 [Cylindrobasidium torrendii FP15055 ss-10]